MKHKVIFVMGVSGSGKTTVGKLLAKRTGSPFFDGDDYHPKANVSKMSAGQPLTDNDRYAWLQSLNALAIKHLSNGAVIACSALKEKYRILLSKSLEECIVFVYLQGSFDEIESRLKKRKGHFMPSSLLKSQFADLEQPKQGIIVSISKTPDEIVNQILETLSSKKILE